MIRRDLNRANAYFYKALVHSRYKQAIKQGTSNDQQKGLADFQTAAQLSREQNDQDLYKKTQEAISNCNSAAPLAQ